MKKANHTFSFIVPAYNCEKYIDDCINSIIEQTVNEWELIIIDDGSTDGTAEKCDIYRKRDDRIKVIHKPNGGVVSARMAGVEIATCDYLAFVDADDWIDKRFLEVMNKAIETTNAEIVRGCFRTFTAKESYRDEKNEKCSGFYDQARIRKELFPVLIHDTEGYSCATPLCGGVIARSLYLPNQITDTRVTMGEDVATMICCMYHANSIYNVDDVLYYYRYNDTSATKGKKVIAWDGPENIYRFIESKIDLNESNFRDQMYRRTAHALFSVIRSRFNSENQLRVVYADIKVNLSSAFYKSVMDNCSFKKTSGLNFMLLAVKHRLYFLIYLYVRACNLWK